MQPVNFKVDTSLAAILGENYRSTEVALKELIDNAWDIDSESENDYNSKYFSEDGFCVFDIILPDNIEACDILKTSPSEAFFIHVKKGFNNSMRDLTLQVLFAAKRIIADIKNNSYQYLRKLYDLTN